MITDHRRTDQIAAQNVESTMSQSTDVTTTTGGEQQGGTAEMVTVSLKIVNRYEITDQEIDASIVHPAVVDYFGVPLYTPEPTEPGDAATGESDEDDPEDDWDDEDGELEIITYVRAFAIEAPPVDLDRMDLTDREEDDFGTWKREVIEQFCGTGRVRGKSWSFVEVTASSNEALIPVGQEFDFGL